MHNLNPELVAELIRRLEIRKRELLGEISLGYKVHRGHHTRDVFSVLAVLKDDPNAKRLVGNLPEMKLSKECQVCNAVCREPIEFYYTGKCPFGRRPR